MSDSRTSTRLRMLLLAAGCAAVLGLAACGGDDDESTHDRPSPTGATGAESTDTSNGRHRHRRRGDLRDQFNQQLLQVLTTTQGLTRSHRPSARSTRSRSPSATTSCRARSRRPPQTGEPPQDLIDAGFEAGQQCADE